MNNVRRVVSVYNKVYDNACAFCGAKPMMQCTTLAGNKCLPHKARYSQLRAELKAVWDSKTPEGEQDVTVAKTTDD